MRCCVVRPSYFVWARNWITPYRDEEVSGAICVHDIGLELGNDSSKIPSASQNVRQLFLDFCWEIAWIQEWILTVAKVLINT